MESISYNTGLTAIIAWDLSVKSSHLLGPLSNKKIGVYPLSSQVVALGAVTVARIMPDVFAKASSRPQTLVQETNRATAVDPERWISAHCHSLYSFPCLCKSGPIGFQSQLPLTDRTLTATAREGVIGQELLNCVCL